MHGPLMLSFALSANYVPKCQMTSGPCGPIFRKNPKTGHSFGEDFFTTLRHNKIGVMSQLGNSCTERHGSHHLNLPANYLLQISMFPAK